MPDDDPSHGASHGGRRWPAGKLACYAFGGCKPGEQVENELRLGAPADAEQMLGRLELLPVGTNQSFPAFSDPAKIVLSSNKENLSQQEFPLTRRLTVLDHYAAGKPVFEQSQAATLAEFWKRKLAAMRAIPFNATLTEAPSKSVAGGGRYQTMLLVPRQPGRHVGRFLPAYDGKPSNVDPNSVSIAMPLTGYGQATFTRWTSRDDNNMLDCYLLAVRRRPEPAGRTSHTASGACPADTTQRIQSRWRPLPRWPPTSTPTISRPT